LISPGGTRDIVAGQAQDPHTILLIHADGEARARMRRVLELEGHRVMEANCGLAGIDLAQRAGPDLILTDIDLPDLEGREVAIALQRDKRLAGTPIVAICAADAPQEREMALAVGMYGTISAPVNLASLSAELAFFLAGGRDLLEDDARREEAQAVFILQVVQRLEARVRQLSERNEALETIGELKNTFINLTAHELRTPISLITGYHRMLSENPAIQQLGTENGNARKLLDGLAEAVQRTEVIVEEVLMASRILSQEVSLQIGLVDLGQTVAYVLEGYRGAIEARALRVAFTRSEWPTRMHIDGSLVELMLSNLISNAIKFTPDGGLITLSAAYDDRQVEFVVRDTGIGIAPEKRDRIFESLQTRDVNRHTTSKTAFQGGGMGLGLAICKGIADAHRGAIRVESAGYDPDRLPGSAFIVVLPVNAYRPVTRL
jgi:signal transduction histidine kinase